MVPKVFLYLCIYLFEREIDPESELAPVEVEGGRGKGRSRLPTGQGALDAAQFQTVGL